MDALLGGGTAAWTAVFPWLLLPTNSTDDIVASREALASVHLQDSRQALYTDLNWEMQMTLLHPEKH